MEENRPPNTTRSGEHFDATIIERVWQKGTPVSGYSSNFRRDTCGAWMEKSRYGDRSSSFGWEIDHEQPVAADGSDDLSNLQPLQWQNNVHKGDNWPDWTCKVPPRPSHLEPQEPQGECSDSPW
jgi:hypothetical protein